MRLKFVPNSKIDRERKDNSELLGGVPGLTLKNFKKGVKLSHLAAGVVGIHSSYANYYSDRIFEIDLKTHRAILWDESFLECAKEFMEDYRSYCGLPPSDVSRARDSLNPASNVRVPGIFYDPSDPIDRGYFNEDGAK